MKKTKKGFTLVELVIVVAVMAVLVAVAIPTVGAITQSAETSVSKTNAQTIESMLKLYEAEYDDDSKVFAWTADTAAAGENPATTGTITTALNEADLGITKGTFYFDKDAGKVVPHNTTVDEDDPDYKSGPESGEFKIVFSDSGIQTTAN